MILNSKVYDTIKWLVLVAIPAVSAAYFGLAPYWGFPNPTEVTGTLAIIATLLGTMVGISSQTYKNSELSNAGILNVDTTTDVPDLYVALKEDPAALIGQKRVTFKINQVTESK